jgi:hypothetical protein
VPRLCGRLRPFRKVAPCLGAEVEQAHGGLRIVVVLQEAVEPADLLAVDRARRLGSEIDAADPAAPRDVAPRPDDQRCGAFDSAIAAYPARVPSSIWSYHPPI